MAHPSIPLQAVVFSKLLKTIEIIPGEWRDGSGVKSYVLLQQKTEFGSQHSHQVDQKHLYYPPPGVPDASGFFGYPYSHTHTYIHTSFFFKGVDLCWT